MNWRKTIASLSVLVTVATPAACGGGSSGLSRTDLVAKGNAICATDKAKIDAIAQPADLSDANQAAPFFDQVVPIIDSQVAALVALKPADSVRSAWDPFIANVRRYGQIADTIKRKADAHDASGLTDLQTLSTVNTTLDGQSRSLGLTACATNAPAAGGSTSAFVTAYAPVRTELNTIATDLSSTLTNASSTTDVQLADKLDRLAQRTTAGVLHLRALTPPASVSSAYHAQTAGLAAIAADISRLATAARAHDGRAARQASNKLVADVKAEKPRSDAIKATLHLPPAK